jgi:hypothetical protein
MKSFQSYLDQYGFNAWKSGSPTSDPIVMMLKDEVATPGSTQLSLYDRTALMTAAAMLKGGNNDAAILQASSKFVSLYFDGSNIPPLPPIDGFDPVKLNQQLEAAYKAYGFINFKHGELNNPFTVHTDLIKNDGTLLKDYSVKTDVSLLNGLYSGAMNAKIIGIDFTKTGYTVVTSKEIFAKLLSLSIDYGVSTAAKVQADFGTYAPDVVKMALDQVTVVPLPPLAALSDPLADTIIKSYIAYFGRPADPQGLQYYVDVQKQSGNAIEKIIDNFGRSPEYNALYSNATPEAKVNDLYHHLFNRDAEPDGLKFWVGNLNSGAVTLTNIAFAMVNGALNGDAVTVAEKVKVARNFTSSIDTQGEIDSYAGADAALNARKYLSTVTSNINLNINIVGIAPEIINGLHSGADSVLASHGLHVGYF